MAISTSFKQECPICEALVPIRDPKLIGKKIKCPKCEGTFVVKEPPDREDEEREEEEPAGKAVKKAKTNGNGKVTDKKPAKPAAKKGKDEKDDSGEEKGKKKKKKDDKTKLGLILGGVAVVVLGVGGYFMFRGDSKKKTTTPAPGAGTNVPNQPNNNQTAQNTTKDGEKKDEGKKPRVEEKSDLVALTSLTPADATGLFSVNVEDLRKSRVWAAGLQTDAAYREGAFEKVFGFPLYSSAGEGVARVLTSVNKKADWVFSAVRTAHKIDQPALMEHLRLEKVEGQPYFLVRRQFDNLGNLLFKANRPRDSYAAYFVDGQTVIFADIEPLTKFLAETTAGEKKDSGTYANLNADLKALLEKVDTGSAPPLVCVVGDADTLWSAISPILPKLVTQGSHLLSPLLAGSQSLPFPNIQDFAKQVKKAGTEPQPLVDLAKRAVAADVTNAAFALTNFTQEALELSVALEMQSDTTAEAWNGTYIKPLLDWWSNAAPATANSTGGMGRTGQPGSGYYPQQGTSGQPKKELPLVVTQASKYLVATYTTSIKSDYRSYTEELAKVLVRTRADSEMANTTPRYHQLAKALMKYVEKNEGKFPRGTAPAKNTKDSDPEYRHPDVCVSWMASLLPFLPETDFRGVKVDPSKEWYKDENLATARLVVPHFVVRGKGTAFKTTLKTQTGEFGVTHFVGMAGLGRDAATYRADQKENADRLGVFGYDRVTRVADIPKDRLDKIIAVIEVPAEYRCPWMAGGGMTVRGVADPWYKLPEAAFGDLRTDGVPDAVAAKLAGLKDKRFRARAELVEQLGKLLTKDELERHGDTVLGRVVAEDDQSPVQPFVSAVNRKGEKGTFAIMADGKVRFVPATVDAKLFRSMCVIKAPTDKDVLNLLLKFDELVPIVPEEDLSVKVISGAADKPGQEKTPEKTPAEKDKATPAKDKKTTPDNPKTTVNPMPGTTIQGSPMPGTTIQGSPMPGTPIKGSPMETRPKGGKANPVGANPGG